MRLGHNGRPNINVGFRGHHDAIRAIIFLAFVLLPRMRRIVGRGIAMIKLQRWWKGLQWKAKIAGTIVGKIADLAARTRGNRKGIIRIQQEGIGKCGPGIIEKGIFNVVVHFSRKGRWWFPWLLPMIIIVVRITSNHIAVVVSLVFLVLLDGMLPIKTVLLNQFDWSKCSHIRLIDGTFRGGIVFVASTTAEYIRKERLDGFEAIHI